MPPGLPEATRKSIGDYRDDAWGEMPSLSAYVRMYEDAAAWVHPAKVIGIALNTFDLSDEDARAACAAVTAETGLPCTDMVRFGGEELVEAVCGTTQL